MTEVDIPDPTDFATSSNFKESVYDQIDDGVPGWMFDIKLEIIWRDENGKELEDYMEEMIK